jgi:hypothetical protein
LLGRRGGGNVSEFVGRFALDVAASVGELPIGINSDESARAFSGTFA